MYTPTVAAVSELLRGFSKSLFDLHFPLLVEGGVGGGHGDMLQTITRCLKNRFRSRSTGTCDFSRVAMLDGYSALDRGIAQIGNAERDPIKCDLQ